MSVGNANLLNAVTLIGMSIWGYLASGSTAKTALIPLIFGVVLLVLTNSIRVHNKTVAHIAVGITLVALVALIAKPLQGAMAEGGMKLVRVGSMVFTGVLALVFFIKSFIDARKAKGNV